jgi:hypothetical protein
MGIRQYPVRVRLRRVSAGVVAAPDEMKGHAWVAAERPSPPPMLLLWMALYALAAVQMEWMRRPFIGAPDLPCRSWGRNRSRTRASSCSG